VGTVRDGGVLGRDRPRRLPARSRDRPGVGLIARVALDEGDWRNWYFRDDRAAQVERRVEAIAADQIAGTALRFALGGSAVATVIAGMRSIGNVERNAAVGDEPPLTAEQSALTAKRCWQRNLYT
jgi:aryl-alcohol dehydrogenase-like predicted oxidoreductase